MDGLGHFLVERLAQPPFSFENLSLISFREKDPDELLQLVCDVVFIVSPNHGKRDVSVEGKEAAVQTVVDFLRVTKYNSPHDEVEFRQGVSEGATELLYPVLKWVLSNVKGLERKAFVGFHLSDVPLPEDVAFEEDVQELVQQMKQLQGQFVEVHKSLEQNRASNKDPVKMKEKIDSMEAEREQLQVKIEQTKQKVQRSGNPELVAEIAEVCTKLRKKQEEEVQLQTSMQRERERMEVAEARYQKAAVRLREIRSSLADGSAGALVSQLADEVSSNRFNVNEKMPREIERVQNRVQAIQMVLAAPVNSEGDLQGMYAQKERVEAEVNELRSRNASQKNQHGDLQLRQQAQVAKSVARKKEEVMAKLERLQQRKQAIIEEYDEKVGLVEGAGSNVLKGDEFKHKYDAVKGKLAKYKKMKKELDVVQAENNVLDRTEALLRQQEATVTNKLTETEKARGVSGFSETQKTLEEVTHAKTAVDEEKGHTLEQISEYVKDINQSIKDRKSKLAPQIKELRGVRQKFQELETEHAEKKKTYDSACLTHENKRGKLEGEVKELLTECSSNESKYHWINAMASITDASIKRVTSGQDSITFRTKLTEAVNENEELAKELKHKQKNLKETAEVSLGQVDVLRDLKRLAEVKLEVSKRGNVGAAAIGTKVGASDVLTL